jgi:hypothetical protein
MKRKWAALVLGTAIWVCGAGSARSRDAGIEVGAAAESVYGNLESSDKAAAISTAIGIAGDLALLPSGDVVILKTGERLRGLGELAKITGGSQGGCGILRNGGGLRCWESDDDHRLNVQTVDVWTSCWFHNLFFCAR